MSLQTRPTASRLVLPSLQLFARCPFEDAVLSRGAHCSGSRRCGARGAGGLPELVQQPRIVRLVVGGPVDDVACLLLEASRTTGSPSYDAPPSLPLQLRKRRHLLLLRRLHGRGLLSAHMRVRQVVGAGQCQPARLPGVQRAGRVRPVRWGAGRAAAGPWRAGRPPHTGYRRRGKRMCRGFASPAPPRVTHRSSAPLSIRSVQRCGGVQLLRRLHWPRLLAQ